MNPDVLKLPWEVQVSLASGYAAYVAAYTGIREHHKTIDTTFIALAFGLVSTAVLIALRGMLSPVMLGATASILTVTVGFLWRRFGINGFASILRQMNVSWSDNTPSSWATLTTQSRYRISQIGVLLDDGTWLRCDDTAPFADAPFGPCRLGPNGDVAIYVTHEQKPDAKASEAKILSSTRDVFYGDRVTYIPASRIKRVTMRHAPPVNHRLPAVEGEAVPTARSHPEELSGLQFPTDGERP